MTKYMRMRQLITKKFLQLSIHYTVIFLTLLYSQGEMKSMYKNSHTYFVKICFLSLLFFFNSELCKYQDFVIMYVLIHLFWLYTEGLPTTAGTFNVWIIKNKLC